MAAFIPLIAAGLGSFGSYLGNRQGARTQTTDQTTISDLLDTSNVNTTQTPVLTPQMQQILSLLQGRFGELLKQNTEQNYLLSGIRAANEAGRIRSNAAERGLAARGLAYSPTGAFASAGAEQARINDIINAYIRAPLQAQQGQIEALNLGTNIARSIPYGQQTTGTTSTSRTGTQRTYGTNVMPGSAVGSGLGTAASLLAYLYGRGGFNDTGVTTGAQQNDWWTPPQYPPLSTISPIYGGRNE